MLTKDEGCLVMDTQWRKQSERPNDLLWEIVGEGSFTKDMVWKRISGRRGRIVEADKKKIWDNRSFLHIYCVGLNILNICWVTGVGLSWFFLSWKANFRGYESYENHFFRFCLYQVDEGWEVSGSKLTKDVWWWILSEGNRPMDQMNFSERWSVKDPLQMI